MPVPIRDPSAICPSADVMVNGRLVLMGNGRLVATQRSPLMTGKSILWELMGSLLPAVRLPINIIRPADGTVIANM